jgi:hypothetical protein
MTWVLIIAYGTFEAEPIEPRFWRFVRKSEGCWEWLGTKSKSGHGSIRARTHCPHGHVYDVANTLIRTNGSRECRACSRAEARRSRERQKHAS